jgi:DNA-binding NtrC family response regulator
VTLAASVAEALTILRSQPPPAHAVLDMRLEDGSGLKVVEAVRDARADAKVIMLTGYGNIATAVAAVKAGVVDYLSKPADADDVARALLAAKDAAPTAAGKPDERRPRPLGAHPARLRDVRPQRVGNGPAAEHAPPHPAADPGQARAAVDASPLWRELSRSV